MLLALFVFLILSWGGAYGTVLIDKALSGEEIEAIGFFECLEILRENERSQKWFLVFEALALVLAAVLVFTNRDYYKAKLIKVTDKIYIPAPAGEGQYGTASFMSQREKRKRYKGFVLNAKDPCIQRLEEEGKKRSRAVKKSKRKKGGKSDEHQAIRIRDKPKYGGLVGSVQGFFYGIKESILSPFCRLKEQLCKAKTAITSPFAEAKEKIIEKFRAVRQEHYEKRKEKCRRLREFFLGKGAAAEEPHEKIKNKDKTEIGNEPELLKGLGSALPKKAGLVIEHKNLSKGREQIVCLTGPVHSLIVGSTGVGKTRRMVIPSVCSLALAGESIVITDPKGEIYAYTSEFLKDLGYEVCVLDFFDMEASMSYNPLQPIIDAVNEDNMPLATTRAWDLTSFLVEKSDKTEPIWSNGEMSVIAAAALCVVCDNRDRPEYQNLANVYSFIANMGKEIAILTGESDGKARKILPLAEYVKALPANHPAKPILGISEVAPDKTGASFYTSALSTLNKYSGKDCHRVVRCSDFRLDTFGSRKQALFFILPDSKTSYYPVVSLIVSQIYDALTESAKKNGNTLDRRVNFLLDEFGNFTKIKDYGTMLTVARGYGIRFNMFIQSFSQLEEKYEKTGEKNIKDNCAWIYLGANDNDTLKDFETKLGPYTTSSYSVSNSDERKGSSNSVNLMERSLLKHDEIGKIKNPWLLVKEIGEDPIVTKLPGLEKWRYNRILGLGNPNHNKAFIKEFQSRRERKPFGEIDYWGVWDVFTESGVTLKNLTEKLKRFRNSESKSAVAENAMSKPLEKKQMLFRQEQSMTEVKDRISYLNKEVKELGDTQSFCREELYEVNEKIERLYEELSVAMTVMKRFYNQLSEQSYQERNNQQIQEEE